MKLINPASPKKNMSGLEFRASRFRTLDLIRKLPHERVPGRCDSSTSVGVSDFLILGGGSGLVVGLGRKVSWLT